MTEDQAMHLIAVLQSIMDYLEVMFATVQTLVEYFQVLFLLVVVNIVVRAVLSFTSIGKTKRHSEPAQVNYIIHPGAVRVEEDDPNKEARTMTAIKEWCRRATKLGEKCECRLVHGCEIERLRADVRSNKVHITLLIVGFVVLTVGLGFLVLTGPAN